MARRPEAVRTIASSLPRYAGEIERAYGESSEFRSICVGLFACRKALSYWEKIHTENGAARRAEYGELLETLEREVLEWLGAHGRIREDEVRG